MHIEVLVEDASGKTFLDIMIPRLLGELGDPHTWRVIAYKGVGHVPKGLKPGSDAAHRVLLDRLPALLRGYDKTPGIDAVVVVLDVDRRDCVSFLAELRDLAARCQLKSMPLYRLAIEELEAWYLGDRLALLEAWPKAKLDVLHRYEQDSACGTWELLADAVHPGGIAAVKQAGWSLQGQLKSEWAARIAPLMDPDRNVSPSFGKLRDGLRRLTQQE
ncbi:hypothetical protein [Lautropia mirabilis]|uniref:hypothetical protein n=1 Tax=Lautropia mirabilis TaxID=47671 RepID=UPI0028EB8B2B|nr:hypothetical protein [Lautropia mirabilis]